MIRLSTAHAKARLSSKVEERDAVAAESILRFALFKEVVKISKKGKVKRRKLNTSKASAAAESNESDEDSSEDEDDEEEEGEEVAGGVSSKRMPMPDGQQVGPKRYSTRSGNTTAADDSGINMGHTSSADGQHPTSSAAGERFAVPEHDMTIDEDEEEAAEVEESLQSNVSAVRGTAATVQRQPAPQSQQVPDVNEAQEAERCVAQSERTNPRVVMNVADAEGSDADTSFSAIAWPLRSTARSKHTTTSLATCCCPRSTLACPPKPCLDLWRRTGICEP